MNFLSRTAQKIKDKVRFFSFVTRGKSYKQGALFVLGIVILVVVVSVALRGVPGFDEQEAPHAPQSQSKHTIMAPSGKPYQFVLMAFDGSRSLGMWKETRQFATEMAAEGKPLHFTYFINPIYLITEENARAAYQGPRAEKGNSAIGYGTSNEDIAARVDQLNLAFKEGHEIGSHAVGHWDGSPWTMQEWTSELAQFDDILFGINRYNPGIKTEPLAFTRKDIVGFRAPQLGTNLNLYKVLPALGYSYDCSRIGDAGDWPYKNKNGTWIFPLANLRVGARGNVSISMDYSLYHLQTQVRDLAKKGTPYWQQLHDELMTAYRAYFVKNYDGNRAPVYVANHFSKWNDGLYWEAMKDFAREVCGKPEVMCVTHKELVERLNATSVKTVRDIQKTSATAKDPGSSVSQSIRFTEQESAIMPAIEGFQQRLDASDEKAFSASSVPDVDEAGTHTEE